MKEFCKLSRIFILFSLLSLVFCSSVTVFGKEPGKRPSLDLTLPSREKPAEVEEQVDENVLEEKYHEIMEEISISPEAAKVVEQIKSEVTDFTDLSLNFVMTQVKGKRTERVAGKLQVSLEHKLARAEFTEPDALRGYIVVINQEKKEARQFRPVTNQIEIQSLDDASQEALSALSMANITSYFDFTMYDVSLLENKEIDGHQEYLLQVDGWQEQEMVQVRVRSDIWVPQEIILYDQDVFVGKIEFSSIVMNSDLTSDELARLPKVKEVRM